MHVNIYTPPKSLNGTLEVNSPCETFEVDFLSNLEIIPPLCTPKTLSLSSQSSSFNLMCTLLYLSEGNNYGRTNQSLSIVI